MLQRMGFFEDAARLRRVWTTLYKPGRVSRMPARLLAGAERVVPDVVDEVAFQTRRNLAHRALVDILPFTRDDQRAILQGARLLSQRQPERVDLPPRFLVSAGSYALAEQAAPAASLSSTLTRLLNERRPSTEPLREQAA
jgi:hypothetical protein